MRPQDLLEGMDPLFPADFLSYNIEVGQKLTLLPDLSDLLAESAIAEVSLSWSEEGVSGLFVIEKKLEEVSFPDYSKGDAIEVFIDTRDNNKASFASRFCHHFVFLGRETNGVYAQEVTKFRQEDTHPLCDPSEILLEVKEKRGSYELAFTLSKEILHGYDPLQFSKLGFAYRIHQYKGRSYDFPFCSKYFEPIKHPALWASLLLV